MTWQHRQWCVSSSYAFGEEAQYLRHQERTKHMRANSRASLYAPVKRAALDEAAITVQRRSQHTCFFSAWLRMYGRASESPRRIAAMENTFIFNSCGLSVCFVLCYFCPTESRSKFGIHGRRCDSPSKRQHPNMAFPQRCARVSRVSIQVRCKFVYFKKMMLTTVLLKKDDIRIWRLFLFPM